MKIHFIILAGILLFNSTFAQVDSVACRKELKHGVEFQIGNNFNLTNFDGYTFSYRYKINNNSGIRIGILTSLNSGDLDRVDYNYDIKINNNNETDNFRIKFSSQYLVTLLTKNNFHLFAGGGPLLTYYKINRQSERVNKNYLQREKSEGKYFGYGIDLTAGVEYQISENVFLSGEYGFAMEYSSGKESGESYTNDILQDQNLTTSFDENRDTFTMGGSGVKLGISVFF